LVSEKKPLLIRFSRKGQKEVSSREGIKGEGSSKGEIVEGSKISGCGDHKRAIKRLIR